MQEHEDPEGLRLKAMDEEGIIDLVRKAYCMAADVFNYIAERAKEDKVKFKLEQDEGAEGGDGEGGDEGVQGDQEEGGIIEGAVGGDKGERGKDEEGGEKSKTIKEPKESYAAQKMRGLSLSQEEKKAQRQAKKVTKKKTVREN